MFRVSVPTEYSHIGSRRVERSRTNTLVIQRQVVDDTQ